MLLGTLAGVSRELTLQYIAAAVLTGRRMSRNRGAAQIRAAK